MFNKKRYKILGILISVLFLYLLFKGINLSHIYKSISEINYYITTLVAGLSVLLVVLKTIRWKYILNFYEKISYKKLFAINMLTHFFNIILPFRAGEFVQVFVTKSISKMSKTKLAGTVVLNKFFELASILLIFFVLTFFIKLPNNWLILIKSLILFVLIFIILFAFNFIKIPNSTNNKFLLKLIEFLNSFKILSNKKLFVKSFILSILTWALELIMIELLFLAFRMDLPLWASLLVLSSINLAILIPASNANLGTYEYAVVLALSIFGVQKELALSFAIVLHFLEIIFVLVLGFVYYINFKKYLKGKKHDEKLDEQLS